MLLTGRRGYLTAWIVWTTTHAVIAALHGVISCWHEAGSIKVNVAPAASNSWFDVD